MKFKHRHGWQSGKIDVAGKKYKIEDGVFEVPDDLDESHVTRLKRAGHELLKEGESKTYVPDEEIQEVDGIGPAYAEDILAEYQTREAILEADAEDMADRIDGLTIEKAEDLKNHLE